MNKRLIITLFTLFLIIYVDGKKSFKSGRSSGAGRSSSRKTSYNPQPVPTSLSYPQASAPKPSLSGWQEKSSKNAQPPKQSKPPSTQTHSYPSNQANPPSSGGHSYPSSQTGLSGSNQAKQPSNHQENIQRSSSSQNLNGQPATNNQPGHSYPASTGLSGGAGAGYPSQTGGVSPHQQGSNYPQGTGLSGTGAGAAPPPYPGKSNNPVNTYQHPAPPPPYSSNVGPNYGTHGTNNGGYGGQAPNHGGYSGQGAQYGGYGGQSPHYGGYGNNAGPQTPGYFGNYGNNYGNKGYGGVSRGGGIGTLAGVGIAGAGVGTILTGLALWNMARSTGKTHHTVVYDNRGQPVAVAPDNSSASETDSILADLVNCSLTISNGNNTEVLAIPCAIATSFRPDADVKNLGTNTNTNDDTKCTVTVVNKEGREYMTTISCATLLNSAAENNVTEPPLVENMNMTYDMNGTMVVPPEVPLSPDQPSTADPIASPEAPNQPPALSLTGNTNDCTPQPGEVRDPLNPCFAVTHDLTVVPLQTTEKNEDKKEK